MKTITAIFILAASLTAQNAAHPFKPPSKAVIGAIAGTVALTYLDVRFTRECIEQAPRCTITNPMVPTHNAVAQYGVSFSVATFAALYGAATKREGNGAWFVPMAALSALHLAMAIDARSRMAR